MSLFGSDIVIILVFAKSIKFLSAGIHEECIFPENVLRHQEIEDEQQFEKTLQPYFSKHGKKQAVIILSDEVLYIKSLQIENQSNVKQKAEEFFSKAPFEPAIISKKVVALKDRIILIASNLHLFDAISDIAIKSDWKIDSVLPLTVFYNQNAPSDLTYNSLKKILKNKTLIQQANMLSTNKYEQALNETPAKQNNQNTPLQQNGSAPSSEQKNNILPIVLVIIFILILGAGAAGFILYKQNRINLPKTSSVSQAPSPIATQVQNTPIPPKEEKINLEDLTVNILNGSEIEGQAGKTKTLLEEKGFKNITTANADETIDETLISFSQNVSEGTKNLAIDALEELFSEVEIDNTETEQFDIQITTGENIK